MANGLQTLLAALAGAGQGASSWMDERRTRQRQDAADALAQENMRRQWEMLTRQENRDKVLQDNAEARENRLEDVAKQNAAVESYGKLIPSAPAIKVGDQELLGPQRGSEVPRPRAPLYEKYGLPLQGGELTGVGPGAAAPPLTLPQGLKIPDTPGPPAPAQAPPLSLPSQRLGTPDFNPLTRPASGTDLQNRLQQAQTQFSLAEGAKNSAARLHAARALQLPADQRTPEDNEALIRAGLADQLKPPSLQRFEGDRGQYTFDPTGGPAKPLLDEHGRQVGPAPRSGTTGVGPSPALVQAIINNPPAYKDLPGAEKAGLIPLLAVAGFDFDSAGGLTPSMRAGVARLNTSLQMLETLDPALTQRAGVVGRVTGLVQGGLARLLQEDTPANIYGGISSALLPALARSSGEVGNLAEQEQVRYAQLAPKVGDALNIRQAKYAALRFIIDAAQKGKTADQLRPFLDYLQFVPGKTQVTTPFNPSEPFDFIDGQ